MVCIYCNGKTKVTNSRPQLRLHQTWRRHRCTACEAVFTTTEVVDLSTSLVVRGSDASIKPFSRDQLFVSILQSVGHRKAPLSDARALTDTITSQLLRSVETALITSSSIRTMTIKALERFDKAAAVQYTAYHVMRS
jgi:transcriptional regulator NrdR family protein